MASETEVVVWFDGTEVAAEKSGFARREVSVGPGPFRLVLRRAIGSRRLALRVEDAIKRLPKAQAEELIVGKIRVDRLIDLARAGLPR